VIEGKRTLVDRRGGAVREAEVTWWSASMRRARSRRGPSAPGRGMKVPARHVDAERIWAAAALREGKTDAEGRFRIEAFHGAWTVQLVGEEREGLVLAGRVVEGVTQIRFDDVPNPDLKIEIYRLDLLPQPHLLGRHFQGDADAYLAHIRERAPAEVFGRALEEAEGAPGTAELPAPR
jgi:hypothetical protein